MNRVTVILSTFNGAAYLAECLESVLAQTFSDFEFRIVDDGSTDQTLEVLKLYANKDSRIILSLNDRNRGTGYCYSKLLNEAQGKMIAQIGQDDRWEPNFLKFTTESLEKDLNCTAVFTGVRIMDSQGNPSSIHSPFQMSWLKELTHDQQIIAFLRRNFVCAGASLFRRQAIQDWRIAGDNDQLQDWNTWQHLILRGQFQWIPEVLLNYRIHDQNLSLSKMSVRLVDLEASSMRLQMFLDDAFWTWIEAGGDTQVQEHRLQQMIQAYLDSIHPWRMEQWFVLLHAMKCVENRFRHSAVFQECLGFLFWRFGALGKARKYLKNSTSKEILHRDVFPNYCHWQEWRWWIGLSFKKPILDPSPWFRLKQVGPFLIGKVCFFKPRQGLPSRLPFFSIRPFPKTAEFFIESVMANQSETLEHRLLKGIRFFR